MREGERGRERERETNERETWERKDKTSRIASSDSSLMGLRARGLDGAELGAFVAIAPFDAAVNAASRLGALDSVVAHIHTHTHKHTHTHTHRYDTRDTRGMTQGKTLSHKVRLYDTTHRYHTMTQHIGMTL
jgi:hypothetical protein